MVEAPAKVNLTLEVVRRRPDGYHDICSVMQAISLADRLTVEPSDNLVLWCNAPALDGPDNLVWRAARLLQQESGTRRGASLYLQKRIPVVAGLGGGSSDAAAAFLALNQLWALGLTRAHLRELGARLGSDVAFFLGESGCALAEGRGERLTPLSPLPPRWLVLVKPPAGISAGAVYARFPPERSSDGSRTRAWIARASAEGSVPPPFDDLEAVALEVAPAAAQARDALLAAGAPYPVMSGSGSTYYALFEREADARDVYTRLQDADKETYLATFADLLPGP